MLLVKSACQGVAALVLNASRSSKILLNPAASAGQTAANKADNVVQPLWEGKP